MRDLNKLVEEMTSINSDMGNLFDKHYKLIEKFVNLKDNQDLIISEQTKHNISDEILDICTKFTDYNAINKISIREEQEDEKLLLVGPSHNKIFKSCHEMFNISEGLPMVIAGPCSIENVEHLEKVARTLSHCNIKFIRGGAYKPRTSPYEFQGLKEDGLKILSDISKKYNLFSVSEVVDTRDVELIGKYIDVIQIGTRNMQNYELLKEVGRTNLPVILKRGMNASIEEFIYAAEYIALEGNRNIILCERGIRTFETKTRNTLDISSIPIIKKETSLPIIVDLSHSLGRKDIIIPIAKSVLAAGADGIMMEVHPKPEQALSDNRQQLNIEEFLKLLEKLDMNKVKIDYI